jgi:hypothetical protein
VRWGGVGAPSESRAEPASFAGRTASLSNRAAKRVGRQTYVLTARAGGVGGCTASKVWSPPHMQTRPHFRLNVCYSRPFSDYKCLVGLQIKMQTNCSSNSQATNCIP